MDIRTAYYREKLHRYSGSKHALFNFKLGDELRQGMQIRAETYYASDFFNVNDLNCFCQQRLSTSHKDSNPFFNITFIRQGYFTFNSYPRLIDACCSNIFLKKPECEYSVTQMTSKPFACTIFNFPGSFMHILREQYNTGIRFLQDPDTFTQQLVATPELEYLHHVIWQEIHKPVASKLFIDCMVIEMLDIIFTMLSGNNTVRHLDEKFKSIHWLTVEKAKHYLAENFHRNISLRELSDHCCVSPFHFIRIFKDFTDHTPFSFLTSLRLKHAEILLKTTETISIADVGFSSGFSSPDYFSAVFSKKYKMSPRKYRTTRAA